jgi:hypothetical protein
MIMSETPLSSLPPALTPPEIFTPSEPMAPLTRPTNVLAILSLLSGISAWTFFPLLGAFLSIIFGHVARAKIKRAKNEEKGDGFAVAGLILGYVQLVVILVSVLLFMDFVISLITSPSRH